MVSSGKLPFRSEGFTPGIPRNRLCRAVGIAPLRGRRRRRFGGEPCSPGVDGVVGETAVQIGGIYARDTTEPALPGRRYRPLEGEAPQALRGGAVFTRRGWCRRGNCRSDRRDLRQGYHGTGFAGP